MSTTDTGKVPYCQLSRYQWGLLKLLRRRQTISEQEAYYIDQRPLISMCRRLLVLRTKQGFILSALGHRLMEEFEHTNVTKATPSKQLARITRLAVVAQKTVSAKVSA